jgi:hypothetical protein
MRFSKNSQMLLPLNTVSDSCENLARTSPCLSGAKLLIFRKCPKDFRKKSHLRRNNEHATNAKNAKTFKTSHLEKPRAFDPRGQAVLTPSGKI